MEEKYMQRCLQLARKGEGHTHPNPMVGAVIVHHGKIVGEGYHRSYGGPHAEVHAIRSVKDDAVLKASTLYVSLEPCAHYGKTPPCAALIISKQIPRVVVATKDPNPSVAGKGIAMLLDAGIDVTEGIMEEEARALNRTFFINQLYLRPHVILKWAQSRDGFMDGIRDPLSGNAPARISNDLTQTLGHRLRTRVQGIMVGTRTAMMDNPRLTARKWYGTNPARIVIDRTGTISPTAHLFDDETRTLVFTENANYPMNGARVKPVVIDFSGDVNRQLLKTLYAENIFSVLVEGGAYLLRSFIEKNMWDDAYIEVSPQLLKEGVKAPDIQGEKISAKKYIDSTQIHLKSKISRNFL